MSRAAVNAESQPRSATLHCTAIGKLLLAHMAEDVRRRLLIATGMPRYAKNTVTSERELERHLAKIRECGYSISNGEYGIGLIAVAVPIRSPLERVVGGLALHAPEARRNLARAAKMIPQLDAAARKLTQLVLAPEIPDIRS